MEQLRVTDLQRRPIGRVGSVSTPPGRAALLQAAQWQTQLGCPGIFLLIC